MNSGTRICEAKFAHCKLLPAYSLSALQIDALLISQVCITECI